MANEPLKVEIPPQVVKKQEYLLLVDYVRQGAWKNNTWLASILDVNDETVMEWKKTKPVLDARREAIAHLLKDFSRRGDVKDRLKETGFQIDPEELKVNVATSQWSDEQLKQFIDTEAARRIAG